ncbi:MAG: DegT/DnrJ/EryC1/StrS aminotransferase family protein [Candidatus Korobacteraceae bacterium]
MKTDSSLASAVLPETSFAPWPYFGPEEIEAAAAVLRSGKVNYWTGEEGRQFEKEFAQFTGCQHAVALANGTVALEAALRALGIGPGDEVITASRTFIASASCVVSVGARPVMADVDRDSQNLTAQTVRTVLTPKTRAIVAVHLAGWPCDMDPIMDLARECDVKVVEDCAQALGARYKGRRVGSLGDAAAFSFCQDKIMTTAGEGGMVTTNSGELWEKIWSYKDHGKSYDAVYHRQHGPGYRQLYESFGTNWRMTEVQSAVGRVALRRVPTWIDSRRRHAQILNSCFMQLPGLRVTLPPPEVEHPYYKYYAFVRPAQLRDGWDRDRIIEAITAAGIPCLAGSCSEIYLEQAFPPEWRPQGYLPVARELGQTSLMFLVHPTLTEDDIRATCEIVTDVMTTATKL